MYCIGLTGTVASGKSTVANYFSILGMDVIQADQIAKALTASEQPAFHQIVDHFGKTVLTDSGELNRRHLRHVIFHDPKERLWLEQLLHPLIRAQIEKALVKTKSPYCLVEIPLLTDKANYPYLNRILLVRANEKQQIARLMARDQSSEDDALAILATQPDEKTQLALADDTLVNTGSLLGLQENVKTLHENYLKYAAGA